MNGIPQQILFMLLTALLCVASIPVSDANQTEKSESVSASQQNGLENTRDDPASNDSESAAVKKSQEDLEQLEDELQLESANRGTVLLDASDRVMEISRAPLTWIQENVPFLTKRNIIFFGRLELDGAYYSSGVLKDDSGFSVRRFRLGLAGRVKIWPGWNYKLEFDLTDSENSLSDAYLSWRSEKWGTFRIGNQKVAQTLSGQTSSLTGTFMERPLPVLAFTLQRRLGLGWDTHLRNLGANITVFSGDPNEGVGSQGWAARGYFNPAKGQGHVFHVGGSIMQLSSDADAQFGARPESHVTSIRLVDTGIWPDVGTSTAVGLELAGSRGPVTIQSEFYRTEWARSDGDNPRFKGWYAEASWFLTGEMANYRDGRFIRPTILGERGAWEVAFRFSTIDLIDEDVQGGTEKNLAFGVNWYSKTHWRFMANLIKVRAKDGPFGDQKPWIVQVRGQYYF
jgi:phosphate-selective porin OprO/OprP